jgi:hypothetical protein
VASEGGGSTAQTRPSSHDALRCVALCCVVLRYVSDNPSHPPTPAEFPDFFAIMLSWGASEEFARRRLGLRLLQTTAEEFHQVCVVVVVCGVVSLLVWV